MKGDFPREFSRVFASYILDVTSDSSIQGVASIEIPSRRNDEAANVCLPRVGLHSHDLRSYISWNWHGRERDSWRGEVTLTTGIAREIRRGGRKTRPTRYTPITDVSKPEARLFRIKTKLASLRGRYPMKLFASTWCS